jgi:hypothetical protein
MADKKYSASRQFTVLPVDSPKVTLRADKLGYDGPNRLIVLKLADDTLVGAFPMENTRAIFDNAARRGKK